MEFTFEMLGDTAEWLTGVAAIVATTIIVIGAIAWRRDRISLLACLGAFVAAIIVRRRYGWDEFMFVGLLMLEAAAAGMIGYSILRWRRFGFSPPAACFGGVVNAALSPLAVFLCMRAVAGAPHWFARSFLEERGPWLVFLMPFALLSSVPIAMVGLACRHLVRRMSVQAEGSATYGGGSEEERGSILRMLADGKVAVSEASDLLKALGEDRTMGRRSPLNYTVLISVIASLGIAVGFVLPWAQAKSFFQAGYHVGALGWVILAFGLLPTIISCIPILDKVTKEGLLRLVFAGAGGGFAAVLFIRQFSEKSLPGVGLWIVVLGFGLHIAGAVGQMGLLRGNTPDDGRRQTADGGGRKRGNGEAGKGE